VEKKYSENHEKAPRSPKEPEGTRRNPKKLQELFA